MKQKTLKALKASIEKWEENVTAEDPQRVKISVITCPLCQLFNHSEIAMGRLCLGCPVMDRTKTLYCKGTPCGDAVVALKKWEAGVTSREAFQAAASKKVEFLKSLLPEENTE